MPDMNVTTEDGFAVLKSVEITSISLRMKILKICVSRHRAYQVCMV